MPDKKIGCRGAAGAAGADSEKGIGAGGTAFPEEPFVGLSGVVYLGPEGVGEQGVFVGGQVVCGEGWVRRIMVFLLELRAKHIAYFPGTRSAAVALSRVKS